MQKERENKHTQPHSSLNHRRIMSGRGVRRLTVLGEFKPYGLVAEALDGNLSGDDEYQYFLFDPKTVSQRQDADDDATSNTYQGDHELFIRGNRIIWTTGSRVYRRFSSPSPVIMACWCRFSSMPEAALCVLQRDSLTIYSLSGEVTAVPIPTTVTSIWPLPFGLLLQQAVEGYSATHAPFSSSSPSLITRNLFRSKREVGHSPPFNLSVANAADIRVMGHGVLMSSHLVLKDLVEELQTTFIEERGKLNVMKDFDESTIWTSDCVPLMATYNRGKKQHSLWFVHSNSSSLEVTSSNSRDAAPAGVCLREFSFRRIWQSTGAQETSSKVFLATDEDAAPVLCLLLQDQKKLLLLMLQTVKINDEILYDHKPDLSWSIPAIAAEPVTVTRPRVKMGALPLRDIVVLAADGTLFLYSGKQCLCRYVLPSYLWRGQNLNKLVHAETSSTLNDYKIIGLADAVDGRINLRISNGKILRCVLRRRPSSSLTDDCIDAMCVGLKPSFYDHFLALLWGNGDSTYLSEPDSTVAFEWESYTSTIIQMFTRPGCFAQRFSDPVSHTAWNFLINSDFHKKYSKTGVMKRNSNGVSLDLQNSAQPCAIFQGSENTLNSELLMDTLNVLHAVYESLKLDNLRKQDLGLLVVLLCDIAVFLGEGSYLDHYIRDFPGLSKKFRTQTLNIGKLPPSLFRWLENCLRHGCSTSDMIDLPPLICKDESSVMSWARKIVAFYSLLCGAKHSGKNLSSGVCCNIAFGSSSCFEELVILAMVGERFGLQQLDLLPFGVSLPLRHALDKCRESPPTDWPAAAYILLGREDLACSHLSCASKSEELDPWTSTSLISMSTPYMLHLHPITIPSSFSDITGGENTKFESTEPVDGSTIDGMDHIFNSSTQLRFGCDLRLNEVRRLLCSSRPVAIQTSVNPTASDQDSQQAQLWHLAQRTTSLPFGRGAFTLATTSTLLTEALAVPKLVLAGRLPAQQNAIVNLDPSMRNIPELKSWPEFHNAVAAGLRLSPVQGKISRTWIMYNKPEEPNAVHAGMLFALGLHGHLHVLNITDIYQYYSKEHESTTIGLMLGLAASYRGTMDPATSKSLYVHITARHQSSLPELELPTLLQPAALMSVGLLYEESAHPQTMQILLAELGRRSGGDNVLEREGYAVAAGFSIGLVALGRGEDTIGGMETFVERLFQYVGGKEVYNDRYMPQTTSADDHNRGTGQMMDGTPVNVDVTAPGAIIALALMFLKTESELVVSKLSIPGTQFDLQYVRPDFIMLRVIARNLIMWSRIHPSEDWIKSQIPEIIQSGIWDLEDEKCDVDEMDGEAFIQAYVNIVAGACISIGLKFAGTRNADAQELLYDYAIYFLNEIKPVSVKSCSAFPKGLSSYVDRGTLEICLHLIVLSLSVVMAGSGHLQTLRLLKFLRSRNPTDGHANYGSQMAVSLATGFLFLGSGMRAFSTTNSAIAALLITMYPRLPSGPNDNRCHLQAFRHLYVLATEGRWVQTVDVDTGLPVYAPLEVTIKESKHYGETSFCEVTPCILPERALLKTVRVCGPRYWPQVMELVPEEKPWWSIGDKKDPFNSGVIYIKRKVGACSYVDDPVGCQSLLSRAKHKVFGLTSSGASTRSMNDGSGAATIDQLVSTFSSDPSLIAFAQLCSDPSWNNRSDTDFQEFCVQVLFECVSKDRPSLLQVYLSMYTMLGAMTYQITSGTSFHSDSLFISSLKLALAYSESLLQERLTNSRGSIIQTTFLGALSKRVKELLKFDSVLENHFRNYLESGKWPNEDPQRGDISILLSWYLQWYSVPSPAVFRSIAEKLKSVHRSSLPLLRLLLPRTHIKALMEIEKLLAP